MSSKESIYELEKHLRKLFEGTPYHTHHLDHLERVRNSALAIAEKVGGDTVVVEIAALFHDVSRHNPMLKGCHAKLSAQYTRDLLTQMGWQQETTDAVCYAIETHRFSTGINPVTVEAKIIQDADRLDALGAIGVIRVVQHSANKPLYRHGEAPESLPDAENYTMDHFKTKILKLIDGFHFRESLEMAQRRYAFTVAFLEEFGEEL